MEKVAKEKPTWGEPGEGCCQNGDFRSISKFLSRFLCPLETLRLFLLGFSEVVVDV